MIIPPDKRVSQRAGVCAFSTANYYASANGVGPAGSTTMTWVTVLSRTRKAATVSPSAYIFSRIAIGSSGWITYYDRITGTIKTGGYNGAVVLITVTPQTGVDVLFNAPFIVVTTLVGGTLTARANVDATNVSTAFVGYTASAAGTSTRIGIDAPATQPTNSFMVHDCAFFNTYDGTAFASAVFGNGLAGLIAMWSEDLQQGRYLTKPQGGALGANDWYWSARDVVIGPTVSALTWTDRGTNLVPMTRTGSPQGSALPMVF